MIAQNGSKRSNPSIVGFITNWGGTIFGVAALGLLLLILMK